MLTHIWSVLCRQSVIDTDTNNITIQNVLEQLDIDAVVKGSEVNLPTNINIPIDYELVSLWYKKDRSSEEPVDIKLSVINPRGTEVYCMDQHAIAPKGTGRLRTRAKITGMVVTDSGDYTFRLQFKNQKGDYVPVAEIPLEVNLRKKQETNQKA
jgi:hypothetical protein